MPGQILILPRLEVSRVCTDYSAGLIANTAPGLKELEHCFDAGEASTHSSYSESRHGQEDVDGSPDYGILY